MTFTIAEATVADLDDVVASSASLFATDAGRHDPDTDISWPIREGHTAYADRLDDPAYAIFLARDGAETLGHLIGRIREGSTMRPLRSAELESLQVYPAHRGRGIGAALVERFQTWARDRGAARATVTAYAANDGAQRFYRRHGFAPHLVTLQLTLNETVPTPK